jgi:hypothetical protein
MYIIMIRNSTLQAVFGKQFLLNRMLDLYFIKIFLFIF